MNFFGLHNKDIGIDLGTASILVAVKSKGIVINEPAIIAVEKGTNDILAVGEEAKEMIGRTPDRIIPLRPLKSAGIADLKATEMLIKNVMNRLKKEDIFNPRVLINVHVGMTEVERRAVLKAVASTGTRSVYLIEETLAAALGAGLDIYSPNGCMVVDLGSGTTEVAAIALGKIVTCDSLRVAGDDLDQDIIEYVRKKKNVEIGKNAAEKIKIELASTKPLVNQTMEIKGRDLRSGFPKTIVLDSFEVHEAIRESISRIIDIIKTTIEKTPPELINNIHEKGIVLTGGTACIKNIDETISEYLKIKVAISDKPLECVALGIAKVIENEEEMKKLRSKRRM